MSSGQLPRIPEPRGSDPDWFRQMKVWCADVVRAIARSRLSADNATLREHNGVLSAIPDFPSMFKVDQTGPDSISVRAGVASRYDGTEGSAATYEMTIVGDGTSASPLDGVELTELAASQWIILTLDETAETLVASGTGDLDIPDSDDGTVIPIALVTMDEGDIVRIFQAHSGPWYLPSPVILDAKSLDRNGDGQAEIKGWADPADGGTVAGTDQLVVREPGETVPVAKFKTISGLLDYIAANCSLTHWDDCDHEHDHSGVYVPADDNPHSMLTDIAAGTAGDDHVDSTRGGTLNNVAYLRLDALGTDFRNAMAGVIGDEFGNESLDPNNRVAKDGSGNQTIAWGSTRTLYDSWRFTGNVGGADFAGITDESGRDSVRPNLRELHANWAVKAGDTVGGAQPGNLTVEATTQTKNLTVTEADINVGGDGSANKFEKHEVLLPQASDGVMHKYTILAIDNGAYP